MAKLTFVIQAPVSDIATHACLLGILQDLQDYPEHQLERLVFVGPAAIFAAREDTVANQLRNIIFAGFTPAPFAYYEDEEEEEEDEYDSNVEDDNFPFSVVYDGRGHLSLVPEFSNDYEDDPSEVLKRRTLLRQTEIVFEQLLAKYHKIVLQSKCEVFVHNVAAQHYQLTPENINSGWSFVDSSGLLDIMQAESKSSHEGDDQHLGSCYKLTLYPKWCKDSPSRKQGEWPRFHNILDILTSALFLAQRQAAQT